MIRKKGITADQTVLYICIGPIKKKNGNEPTTEWMWMWSIKLNFIWEYLSENFLFQMSISKYNDIEYETSTALCNEKKNEHHK